MNILITLPKEIISEILSGNKKFEMRKCIPKNLKIGEDGFFVVEKGTDLVRCWCRVDSITDVKMTKEMAAYYSGSLGVTQQFILKYAPPGTRVYLWEIGKTKKFYNLHRRVLIIDRNPQQFAYAPLSYGESF